MPVPFRPPPTSAPIYIPASDTWVFSRHADVSSALGAPQLSQPHIADSQDEQAQHDELKAAVQADIDRLSGHEWLSRMTRSLSETIASATRRKQFDLVADVIHPWTTMIVVELNAQPNHADRLATISRELLLPLGTDSARRQEAGDRAVDEMIQAGTFALSKSMFFGFTQTLTSFLAKAWLALLMHPASREQLIAGAPISNAAEELLRYAGVVHTVRRAANADVRIGAASIRRGQNVTLEVDSANFDPERFDSPQRLDFTRRAGGHLALGRGLHACVGSYLVRMACSAAIPLFTQSRLILDPSREIEWTGDRTLLWPVAIPVQLQH
ncbi:MAG TPA: cytochrome P450 [Acidobacteriaceae bacterium]|jgi:cytochrome P450|nr:cytochrome P450 [Acidobacteriaceae bacterium]